MGKEFESELSFVRSIIQAAGQILLDNYDSPNGVRSKSDGTLVCAVDEEVSEFLSANLLRRFPGYGLLDEERVDDGSRFSKKYCWVVDPLDSTRQYIQKSGKDYSVIIGLLEDFVPVLGVTYKPYDDELVFAVRGQGAYRVVAGKKTKIHVSNKMRNIHLITTNFRRTNELAEMISDVDPTEHMRMSGSLKIVEVAKGNVNLYLNPTTNSVHYWDICGPQVILQESGGKLTDKFGSLIDFSQKDTRLTRGLVGSNGHVHRTWD